MFIFRRTKEPNTGFLVMNRLTPDNLIVYITSNMEIEISGDFVIYKTDDGKFKIFYIYIYIILIKILSYYYFYIYYCYEY